MSAVGCGILGRMLVSGRGDSALARLWAASGVKETPARRNSNCIGMLSIPISTVIRV